MSYKKHLRLIISVTFLLACSSAFSKASSDLIILGQSAAFSGSSASLGTGMRTGILAALDEINSKGGVKGRDVVLISKDDGYEPYRASQNVNELIEVDEAFILIGNVGTPTTEAVVPILNAKEVPLLAPFTGASSLRNKNNKNLIHARASYRSEITEIVNYLVDEQKVKRIACFYQNDSYGFTNLEALEEILENRGLSLVASGFYERNTLAVLGALERIHQEKPDAIILIGSYLASAEFIKLSKIKKEGPTIFCNISFVGSRELKMALGDFGEGVIVSQVVPYPWDKNDKLAQSYLKALRTFSHDEEPSFISFEGYIAGRLFAAIAEQIDGELSRNNFYKVIEEKKKFVIDDSIYDLSSSDNDKDKIVYLTQIYPQFKKVK